MADGRQRGWFGRNWKWFVPVSLLTLVLLCSGCFFGLFGGVAEVIRSAEPYQVGVERARADAAVVEALGEPIEEGFFVQGTVKIENQGGNASLAVPISGPNGSATLYVEATRTAGAWTYQVLEVDVDGREERIDLRPR